MDSSDLGGDGYRRQSGEQMLNDRAAASPARSSCPMHPVQQLAHRDHANRTFLLTEKPLELRRADTVLEINQEISVDQDGHGCSGAPTASRSACSSAANS